MAKLPPVRQRQFIYEDCYFCLYSMYLTYICEATNYAINHGSTTTKGRIQRQSKYNLLNNRYYRHSDTIKNFRVS